MREGRHRLLEQNTARLPRPLPTHGDDVAPIVPDCSLFCAIEFQNIEDPQTAKVMHGEIGINETR